MLHIASLVSNPDKPAVDAGLVARVASVLPAAGMPVWLAEGVAADIPFEADGETRGVLAAARVARAGAAVDLNILPAEGRRKSLLIADMDSTMIEQECLDELAGFAGLKEHVAAISERTMRGELEFEPALRERVALLNGLKTSAVDTLLERITLTPGARTLVATMRAHRAYTALVSGGFTLFTQPIAQRIGFDENRANVLGSAEGLFDGALAEPILGRETKRAALIELREKLGLAHRATLAVGDGANDLAMIGEAGLGVAFRAKPIVAEAAAARIEHGDLTGLLYLQGYRRDEFAVS